MMFTQHRLAHPLDRELHQSLKLFDETSQHHLAKFGHLDFVNNMVWSGRLGTAARLAVTTSRESCSARLQQELN